MKNPKIIPSDAGVPLAQPVHLFVDNSNIFVSAKDVAELREGKAARSSVRLQFDHLFALAIAGRPIGRLCVVGSVPPEQDAVWRRLEDATGVKPELYERGKQSGGEQGLDQCLQVHMLRAISDFAEPQTVVLMTGDGAGYDTGAGFHADMERMHAAGWGIEVVSWKNHCRRALRDWAAANGVFVSLDDHYEYVTFLEGGRPSQPAATSNRPLSLPRHSLVKRAEMRVQEETRSKIAQLERQVAELTAAAAVKKADRSRYEKRYARGSK
ncbi:NYN domain-containing protein [Variovorax paradoxus]|uniref:NYN domain-containing protein n=1 Tax=Variovorax paradoxus TaxID=34073 RepID=UPI002788D429|nr:NYN domain-containing protein [Variovorax paradoxus]MDP9931564.1 hypothetical protein [Variovorax paradoxus]